MIHPCFFVLCLCLPSPTGDPTGAGDPALPIGSGTSLAGSAFGLGEVDGRLVGGGPDWRAEFADDGFSFTAAFGSTAPRTWPLTWQLASVRREQGPELIAHLDATPRLVDGAIEYARATGLSERYEARRDGVEQTFVFAKRPAGNGDLVVHGTITTDLAPRDNDGVEGLAYHADGFGDVTLGGVTGIDANGRRQAGSIRRIGNSVEYVLPAAFVDTASYPLVLDPLFGVSFIVAAGFDEVAPDASFDASSGRFLVVWQRAFSFGDRDIRGQMLNADGTLVGAVVFIDTDPNLSTIHPRVANVNATDHFVVVWQEVIGFGGQVRGRTVLTSNGAMGNSVTIGATSGFDVSPDVGGETNPSFQQAMAVWHRLNTSTLRFEVMVARLVVSINGSLSVGAPLVIDNVYNDSFPSISSTGGPTGVYMIVWKRVFDAQTNLFDAIRGATFDRNLNLIDSFIPVTTNSGGFPGNPAVDGDGTTFLVAYEKEPTLNSGDKDVHARAVFRTAAGIYDVGSSEIAVDVGALNSDLPDVGWLGGSAMVGFRQLDLTNKYRAMIAAFDPTGGAVCEGYFQISSNSENTKAIRIGVASDDLALVAFEAEPIGGGDGVIRAQRFLAKDGAHKSLGGACSSAAYASCARIDNSQFAWRLTAAPPLRPTYLILGTNTIAVPCGSCVLTVDPASGLFLAAGLTNAQGRLDLVTGIPNNPVLVGLKVAAQWLTLGTSGSPCPSLQGYFSNGLEVTIQ